MEILLVLTIGALCIFSFTIGAQVSQAVKNGENIKLPTVNPIEAYREHEQKKAAREEQERLDTIMRNIESYDGTADKQEDVPGR